jgi:hypothetical protein
MSDELREAAQAVCDEWQDRWERHIPAVGT